MKPLSTEMKQKAVVQTAKAAGVITIIWAIAKFIWWVLF